MFQIDRRIVTHFDFLIPILVIPIIAISYYLISEANTMLANKQLVYFAVGIAAFFIFFITPLKKILVPLPITATSGAPIADQNAVRSFIITSGSIGAANILQAFTTVLSLNLNSHF